MILLSLSAIVLLIAACWSVILIPKSESSVLISSILTGVYLIINILCFFVSSLVGAMLTTATGNDETTFWTGFFVIQGFPLFLLLTGILSLLLSIVRRRKTKK
ncbi:hypothetical protein A374_07301 [Fictibacillus macauensis ZFHKF-1]|uniref:Uncharacterized protein n=1 Tax=Fictibacillus macauensis ZFHKF-1 TaxID=1196324 RepID=I8UH23_9BACL|nr:hypothetical protein [Fictibacillus macauensis]EIT86108.1 hypothetical protein A374_07301 [Fictibacillus macauensis ZFHKF-1]